MVWNADENETLTRAQAIEKIKELAREKGITQGIYKVYYRGDIIPAPADLPADGIDGAELSVSRTYTQA